MKTTVVPAQVTTVEDKIAGNLNFTQLLLLATPVFLSGAIFAFLPPFMSLRSYKLMVCMVLVATCLILALRIRGKIVLTWVTITGRYNLRPRYYIYDKNDLHLRIEPQPQQEERAKNKPKEVIPIVQKVKTELPFEEIVRIEHAVADPRTKFHFKTTKKGGLSVHIQEIKQ